MVSQIRFSILGCSDIPAVHAKHWLRRRCKTPRSLIIPTPRLPPFRSYKNGSHLWLPRRLSTRRMEPRFQQGFLSGDDCRVTSSASGPAFVNRLHDFFSPSHGIRDCADRRGTLFPTSNWPTCAQRECWPRSTARVCGPRPVEVVELPNTDPLRSFSSGDLLVHPFLHRRMGDVTWIEKPGSARNSQFRASDRLLLPTDRSCNENRSADAA
jgi:hypothetical protein